MGASKSNSSSSIDSGGEELEPFAPSTPTPQNRGGLFRTPSNTTLAVDFATVTKRKGKGKAAAAPIPSKQSRLDDRARGASSDDEALQPIYSNSQLNAQGVTINVKDLLDRIFYFRVKTNIN
jgi:hypothetical protein